MTIRQVEAVLGQHPDIRLAYVFGSVAAGTAHRESDVDLAILCDAAMTADQQIQLISDIAEATGRAVDLIDLATVGEPLLGQNTSARGARYRRIGTACAARVKTHPRSRGLHALRQTPTCRKEAAMGKLIVERKLGSLMRCIARIRSKTPADINELLHDLDLQDVLVLNLSRAVQVCVDIAVHILSELKQPPPETIDKAFDMLAEEGFMNVALAQRLKRSVGFRNLAVHNFDVINSVIVYTIATKHLADFEAFAKTVIEQCFAEE
ncbi:type VII toxin-antitoxin system HepT family RNase toxin [Pseudomonas sp. NPDC077382]